MFPILFTLGPIEFRTMTVFAVLGFFAASFVYWRRGREEHYSEEQLFDAFYIAVLIGVLASRAGFIVLNFPQFGFQILHWFDVIRNPGFDSFSGLVVSSIVLFRRCRAQKWDEFEILDFWATAMAVGLIFVNIGQFFEGSGSGYTTSMPWGIQFPSLFEPAHPVQLYLAIAYGLLFWFLSRVEYRYRTFSWYRSGKKTAQTGFVFAMFVISSSFIELSLSILRPSRIAIGGLFLERTALVVFLLFGLGLLYVRSGRSIGFLKKKKPKKVKIEQFSHEN
ncbi:MAG: prolipoprotein diacylglyceryl transferase family protein [Microgenomates group bacterium]